MPSGARSKLRRAKLRPELTRYSAGAANRAGDHLPCSRAWPRAPPAGCSDRAPLSSPEFRRTPASAPDAARRDPSVPRRFRPAGLPQRSSPSTRLASFLRTHLGRASTLETSYDYEGRRVVAGKRLVAATEVQSACVPEPARPIASRCPRRAEMCSIVTLPR